MKSLLLFATIGLSAGFATECLAQNRLASPPPLPASRVQPVLDAAADDGKFTFIVFTKGETPASKAMIQTVKDGVGARSEQAKFVTADANAAGEQTLVEKYGLARAPMPITVAVAPNGALTGVFSKVIKDEQMTSAIVPPTMMRCMKSLQENKLVFVCLTNDKAAKAQTPAGVRELQQDPDFQERIELVAMDVNDRAEARLIEQMKVDPARVSGSYAVLIAPPGVLIGHYNGKSTSAEIAAAIHKAGKCCDDANCKHNHASPVSVPTPKTTTRKR